LFTTKMNYDRMNVSIQKRHEERGRSMLYPIPAFAEYSEEKNAQGKIQYDSDLLRFYNTYKDTVIDYTADDGFADEEYLLLVDPDRVSVSYKTEAGKFRALTSLRQLIEPDGIPCCKISDKPHLEHRGYMLDISRGRIPKMETILSLVDLLADLKYNEFQLYMESFCFKYDAFPEYTKDFDCLTPEDIEYLDGYCRDRFIDLIPNQNSFGHMEAWLQKEELSHLALGDETGKTGVLNPLDDGSLELMDKIYGSLLPHFRSAYVHVGLDEVFGLGKYQTKEACEKDGVDGVFIDYLTKINTLVNTKYEKKIQFWDDMIIEYPDSFPKFPENITAVEWGYGVISTQFMEERCRLLKEKGVRFYVAPGNAAWVSLTSRTDVMEFNVRTAGELAVKYGAAGMLFTDWGVPEDGHPQYLVHSYLPCALGAQYSWNAGEPQPRYNFKHAFRYGAFDYLDKNVFRSEGVTELMYQLGKYYQLEPHRCHSRTLCASNLVIPLSKRARGDNFDFDAFRYDRSADFCFGNVIRYVKSICEQINASDLDDRMKREILVNGEMILLGAEICLVKAHRSITEEKRARLLSEIDRIIKEHTALWDYRNYHEGIDIFLNHLRGRRKELEGYGK